jgi:hypothetical protein
MKILKLKNFEELLLLQWTKFVDYESIQKFITNNILLYASNWSTIINMKQITTKKIFVSKTEVKKDHILFWISFEIPMTNKCAVGTAEINCTLDGTATLAKISGNFYQTTLS